MTLIEKIARHLCIAAGLQPDVGPVGDCERPGMAVPDTEPNWRSFVTQAQCLLQAIRDPSDAVTQAGLDILAERGCNPLSGDADAAWQAMIDAALSERP